MIQPGALPSPDGGKAPPGYGNERNTKMEFLKTPRSFAMELVEMNGNSAGEAMTAFLLHLKARQARTGIGPDIGVGAAWAAGVLIEIAKLREAGLVKA